jgi:class 3 adenylate cyclase
MLLFAQLVNPEYDIYKRMNLKEGMPIPHDYAAQRIVSDMIEDGFYIDFVETLIDIENNGYMGHSFQFWGLNDVVTSLINIGFSYDNVSGQFFENAEERISPNWGRLHEGDEHKMTVLRIDIAGNSILVKNNPRTKIEKAYNDLRKIVNNAVISRFGRLWSWEGDGALAAFMFGSIEQNVIFAGMEILHELFFYNHLNNQLDSPINLWLGAHIGQIKYSENEIERLKNETVGQAVILEEIAPHNGLCVSYKLYAPLGSETQNIFSSEKTGRSGKYRIYSMEIEK